MDSASENLLLSWQEDTGLRESCSGAARLLVADSWLVEHGKVRGLDLHRRRFAASSTATGAVSPSQVDRFWSALVSRLPREGNWFPRAELVDATQGPGLRLRLRPAPARTDRSLVWVHAGKDPRTEPRVKGPDLGRLTRLRELATRAGANEALLTTHGGFVLEAANSSLLWWEGDRLCLPDPHWRLLTGVTTTLILRAAHASGISVRRRRRRLADLAGHEVWLANALHGIRPVVGWVGSDVPAGTPHRAGQWREWWQRIATALPTPAPAGLSSRVGRDL